MQCSPSRVDALLILILSIYFTALVIRLFLEFRLSEAVPAELVEKLDASIKDRKFQELYDAWSNLDPSKAAKFYAKFGVKAEDFVATANSFTINTRMKQADAYIKAAGVDVTPTIIVNGKYRLTTSSAGGGWDKAQQLILYLVKKESGGK